MKHIVITIGREYGSGGRLIAQRLAEELGVTFYDKQLIAEVAKRTGFSEHFVRDAEHQRPTNSFLYDLYCAVQTPSVPDQMFIAQAKVIKEAAARESCVIVGRCADYILREEPYCLKTFVYAGAARAPGPRGVQRGAAQSGELCTAAGQGPRFLLQLFCHRAVGGQPGVRSVHQQPHRH